MNYEGRYKESTILEWYAVEEFEKKFYNLDLKKFIPLLEEKDWEPYYNRSNYFKGNHYIFEKIVKNCWSDITDSYYDDRRCVPVPLEITFEKGNEWDKDYIMRGIVTFAFTEQIELEELLKAIHK